MKLAINLKNVEASDARIEELNIALEYSEQEFVSMLQSYPTIVEAIMNVVKEINL